MLDRVLVFRARSLDAVAQRGEAERYTCKPTGRERIACDDGSGVSPWVFYRGTYTRAYLGGPPAGGLDPNIWMAYGTCTGF